MTQLSKVQKICEQIDISSASANEWLTTTINKTTLNMPGGNLPITDSNYEATYFTIATVLCIGNGYSTDGVKRLSGGWAWSSTNSSLWVKPTIAQQPTAVESFITYDFFDLYFVANAYDAIAMAGTPDYTANELNIVIQPTTNISFPVKFKLFVDIYSFADDSL